MKHKLFFATVRQRLSHISGTMPSAEMALVCGLKVWVGCQDRLCVNSDADETPA